MKAFREEWREIVASYKSGEYLCEIEQAKEILQANPFVLYGAGAEGLEFANVLRFGKVPPVCFCDKFRTGFDPPTGLNIIAPSDLLGQYKNVNIVISSWVYHDEIEQELLKLGIESERILSRRLLQLLQFLLCSPVETDVNEKYLAHSHYLMRLHAFNDMVADENNRLFQGVEYTYSLLSDDESKRALIDYLELYFIAAPVKPSPAISQYFDPVMALTDKEVFVDCGAYTGDTAEIFMRNVGCNYKHYYAFEPDSINREKAAAFLADYPNATLIPKGLWYDDMTLHFTDGCTSRSEISENGESSIEVTSLDKYFMKQTDSPTIIKMDIEGSELNALKGAEQLIRLHKPKLAICIYHKPEDLYEIPLMIKNFRADYKFYVRHYSDMLAELVLYAI
jgi:FkbM family methyltransferase